MLSALALMAMQAGGPPVEPEIVVTGERSRRTVRETASSVAVFSNEQVDDALVDRVETLVAIVPNVQEGSEGIAPAVRGLDGTGPMRDLTAFIAGVLPRTTLQIDGRESDYAELVFGAMPLWDVAQVEMFRSPQIVAQGRPTAGGAIYVTTRDPRFRWEGSARAMGSTHDTLSGAIAVSLPIADEVAALRLSGEWRDGEPSLYSNPIQVGASPNEERSRIARAKLLVKPNGIAGAFRLTYAHSEGLSPQGAGIRPPFEERRDERGSGGVFRTRVDALSAEYDGALGGGWRGLVIATRGWSRIQRHAPPRFGETLTFADDWSIETRVERQWNRTSLAFGAHHLDQRKDQRIDLSRAVGFGTFADKRTASGAYVELGQQLTSRLGMTLAARRQRDRQLRVGSFAPEAASLGVDADLKTMSWQPRLTLDYDLDPDWRIGLLVQRASTPPGASVPLIIGDDGLFGGEKLLDAEIYARGRFANGRGRVQFNLFRYWIEDYQRPLTEALAIPDVPPIFVSEVVNVPEARIGGLEAEFGYRLSPRLEWTAAIGMLTSRIVDNGGIDRVAVDGKLARTPAFSGNTTLAFAPTQRWRLSATLRGSSGYYSDDENTPELRVGGVVFVDVRAERRFGKARLSVFARNLFDRFALKYYYASDYAFAHDPREVGVALDYDF
ncbi:TonB-dependent receptor [Sphingomicrobium nitratireducens]|uniref:TonB-dependent receptor n=1 Tax=Sphingomicrobium nitratireducens TaxID=2964666 RepID=UPI00223EAAA4|nr:TonB-dependent receptor [Sphingomicrobium nitratireducens]